MKYYATVTARPSPASEAYPSFRDFCLHHKDDLRTLITTREVQVNEVRRCTALLPALAWVWRRVGERPLALVDVGAAAGLNLLADHFHYDFGLAGTVGDPKSLVKLTSELRGTELPVIPKAMLPICWRMGIDPHPVNVADSHATNWLVALVSPDDTPRLRLLEAALKVARLNPPTLVAGRASDSLLTVLDRVPQEVSLCIFHSFVMHHFSTDELDRFAAIVDVVSARRNVSVISLEWERENGRLLVQQPISLRVAMCSPNHRTETLLAIVDGRGGCEWLEWLDGG
jgi:hypothetical protein